MRQAICILVLAACAPSEKPAPAPSPQAWMPRLIAPARPCLQRFKGRLPDPYLAQVRVTPVSGDLALAFESGQALEFNACVIDAVTHAHISARGLDGSVVIPVAFSSAAAAAG